MTQNATIHCVLKANTFQKLIYMTELAQQKSPIHVRRNLQFKLRQDYLLYYRERQPVSSRNSDGRGRDNRWNN